MFKLHKKAQQGIMGIVIAIILVVAVAIPVTNQVITDANLTGTTSTVVELIPLLLGVAGLATVVAVIRFR